MMRIALSLVALVVTAAPLAAQHGHQHTAPAAPATPAQAAPAPHAPEPMPMMSGMHQDGMPMAGGMGMVMDSMMSVMHRVQAFAPARVVERAAELGLGAEQQTRVEQIGAEAALARDSAMATAMAHQRELADALAAGTPAPAAAEAHFAAAHAAMGAAHLADLRAAIAVMGILTDLQRGRLGAAGAAPCPGCGQSPGAAQHPHDATAPTAPRRP